MIEREQDLPLVACHRRKDGRPVKDGGQRHR
jgi:hypothetical protein